ncbi:hypothetical protein BT69DRAFT_1221721 [Atractiella rhizophila]|nr:hypothetical protein BT69DRAFT_1221721 [Atractiella rhizophila]
MEETEAAPVAEEQQVQRRIPPLRDNKDIGEVIFVVDAQKTTEGSSSSYIAYVIRSPGQETRRRYSEFESLRNALVKLHPVLIIPPLPPKQSLGEYATKPSRVKEDVNVIARRKRMLQVFLNRLARHPILGTDAVFEKFLQGGLSWAEISHQPPMSLLPKNILRAPAKNPTDIDAQMLYSALPVPSSSQPLQDPDQRFIDSEIFTAKFSAHLQGSLEKVNRRLMKRWGEYGGDMAEMGAVMNGFALLESKDESLQEAIEKTGQAVDAVYMNTSAMLQEWEKIYTEPLAEYSQFSSIIKQLLKFRHMKHLQFEMSRQILDSKQGTLEELERSEAESRRLDRALSRVREIDDEGHVGAHVGDGISSDSPTPPRNEAEGSPSPPEYSSLTGSSTYGFLGALQHTIQGMMDVDPEATRRNNIGKTRDTITQLQQATESAEDDLRYCSQTIQADLDRFQRQKVSDLKRMTLAFAQMHRQWCAKNLEQWETALSAIKNIQTDDSSPS